MQLPVADVSTHSRPKAAGSTPTLKRVSIWRFNTQPPEGGWTADKIKRRKRRVSTHSRPKAAGHCVLYGDSKRRVSTHSRPKAAGRPSLNCSPVQNVSTHSRPKAAGSNSERLKNSVGLFQHTAARRRLVADLNQTSDQPLSFNTQPPEGGWSNVC